MRSTFERQEDGDHYKNRGIQPIQFCQSNNLGACESFAIKHLARHRDKGESLTDLKKAIHYIQMLIEMEHALKSEVTYDAVCLDVQKHESPQNDPGSKMYMGGE